MRRVTAGKGTRTGRVSRTCIASSLCSVPANEDRPPGSTSQALCKGEGLASAGRDQALRLNLTCPSNTQRRHSSPFLSSANRTRKGDFKTQPTFRYKPPSTVGTVAQNPVTPLFTYHLAVRSNFRSYSTPASSPWAKCVKWNPSTPLVCSSRNPGATIASSRSTASPPIKPVSARMRPLSGEMTRRRASERVPEAQRRMLRIEVCIVGGLEGDSEAVWEVEVAVRMRMRMRDGTMHGGWWRKNWDLIGKCFGGGCTPYFTIILSARCNQRY